MSDYKDTKRFFHCLFNTVKTKELKCANKGGDLYFISISTALK